MMSSLQWNAGFQQVDVDSIAAIVTPSLINQSRITMSMPVIILNVLVCDRRR